MKNDIERLCELFKAAQAKEELSNFAKTSETDELEHAWKDFGKRAVEPAFARVRDEVLKKNINR